ncbi:MAG TPA: LAGLIDADG family homing endonuclease [Pyrinomonadaceae bacterium]|nr:LAGLIDADG family homing endonuclease [Pyrinomonadaceae bacterium]
MPHPAWNKRPTPEVEGFIVEQYRGGLSAGEILKAIPFKTKKTVYDVLERHGVGRRGGFADYKKRFDEAAFAVVDSPAKAYWLGLLITDGYVIESKTGSPLVGLQMIDREAAEGFRDFLGLQHPVLRIGPKAQRHRPMHRAVCHSRRMAADLARFGVVPRKSHATFLPLLAEDLMPHLARGLFDGDGTVSRRSDGRVLVGFCGSERLVAELRMWLICRLGISDNRVHENGSIRFVQWSHRADVTLIARYIYRGGGPRLSRKYGLLRECL